MDKNVIFESLASFLKACVGDLTWKEANLQIQIQPGSLGLNGFAFDGIKNLPIQVRPSEEIKLAILLLHKITATNSINRWNEMKFVVLPDSSYKASFIWNQERQKEVDETNLEYLENNPAYKLPKWDWEMTKNEQLDAIFFRMTSIIKDYLWGISFKQAKIFIRKEGQDFELSGRYIPQDGDNSEQFSIDRYYISIVDSYQLWDMSTKELPDSEKWNLAIFTLYPTDKYEIEYWVNNIKKTYSPENY